MKAIKHRPTARAIGAARDAMAPNNIKTALHMTAEERLSAVYSRANWQRLRAIVKEAGFNTCVSCGIPSAVLDHIYPVQVFPTRAFDPENVQPLCVGCHDAKTKGIDAPGGNVAAYRHDMKHKADMRPDTLKQWARMFVESGEAERLIGPADMHANKQHKKGKHVPKGWLPSC